MKGFFKIFVIVAIIATFPANAKEEVLQANIKTNNQQEQTITSADGKIKILLSLKRKSNKVDDIQQDKLSKKTEEELVKNTEEATIKQRNVVIGIKSRNLINRRMAIILCDFIKVSNKDVKDCFVKQFATTKQMAKELMDHNINFIIAPSNAIVGKGFDDDYRTKKQNLRSVMMLYPEYIVALTDKKYTNLSQLLHNDKNIITSEYSIPAMQDIMQLNTAKITDKPNIIPLRNARDIIDKACHKKTDATVLVSIDDTIIKKIIKKCGLHLFAIPQQTIDSDTAAKYLSITIPPNQYGNTKEIKTISSTVELITNNNDDTMVFNTLENIINNIKYLHNIHPAIKSINIDDMLMQTTLPLHAGTENIILSKNISKD
jgi:TRAP-type uncharacterized transport system substrate-binding protein